MNEKILKGVDTQEYARILTSLPALAQEEMRRNSPHVQVPVRQRTRLSNPWWRGLELPRA